MSVLHLVEIGTLGEDLLERLHTDLADDFRRRCEVLPLRLDPEFAFHAERQQYHSTELLERLRALAAPATWRLLGVTPVDLYIPILTFVFGEAQLEGRCAVVSTHRLRQEFYGLPADKSLLQERLRKEAAHELGHTLGLRHCEDFRCAMAPSHSVEWIDLKESSFCATCAAQAGARLPATNF